MKVMRRAACAVLLLVAPVALSAQKTYKHASEYQVATLDQTLRVATGSDLTRSNSGAEAKLSGGGQGIHLLYTDAGNFRVEAPVNKGMSLLAAMATPRGGVAPTVHNRWFLDNVQPGTKVLFASECGKPNKKHPYQPVRCTFWFPDPDSTSHEYETIGDFTPYVPDGGSNVQRTANTLCGTGKLKPEVEAQLCSSPAAAAPAAPPAPPLPSPTVPASHN